MKKRITCTLMTLTLVLNCLGTTAWAKENGVGAKETDQIGVTELVEPILNGFDFEETTSDLKKVMTVYDYVTTHISFNKDSSNHSAHDALVSGTASSYGISDLLYQMLELCDVSALVITGTVDGGEHAWNLVELKNVTAEGGPVYYNVDAALGAGTEEYRYFLCSDSGMTEYDRDAEFDSTEFRLDYPTAGNDFDLTCWENHYFWNFSFTWHGDFSTVRATSKCELCRGLYSESCAVSSSITQEATHTQYGEICYEGAVVIDGVKIASQQKVVTTDKLEGHSYATPQWSWMETDEGQLAQAVFFCTANDGHFERVNATVTGEETSGSCQDPSVVTYTAAVLFQGETYTDALTLEVESVQHNYVSVVTPPTCTEQGNTTHTCVLCGDSYSDSVTEAQGHDVTEFTVTREPTAVEPGEQSGVCVRCGETITEEIPALGDESSDDVPQETPDQESDEDFEEEHQHYYTGAFLEATCTEPGGVFYTCACGDSCVEDGVPALGHSYSDFRVTASATCTEPGEIVGSCIRCGLSVTEVLPAAGHNFDNETVPATCVQQGYTAHTCSVCGYEMRDSFTELVEHSYDDGLVTLEPAAGRAGLITYTCRVCGSTRNDRISGQDNPFEDVPAGAFYYQPVLWAYRSEITSGVDSTHFAPDTTCTRGHVVTFLWRTVGCPEPESLTSPFVDVTADQYYYKAVLWAFENGITTGIDQTHFGPDVTVNRAQVVTFLYRTAGEPLISGGNPFADVFRADYYQKAVLWAYQNDITAGIDENHFTPGNPCTRGQVVTFLYRYRQSEA